MTNESINVDTAIIGGTGLYKLDGGEVLESCRLTTRWGTPSADIIITKVGGAKVAFLTRHGSKHNIPPHKVNYRANLWVLKECGVKRVFAIAAVGGVADQMAPETLVIPDQIIDYTYGRDQTYFEDEREQGEPEKGEPEKGEPEQVTHIDFTSPYTQTLREQLLATAAMCAIDVVDGGVYGATQGPRLETAAEVQRLKRDGVDIVGMTGMPEAALARELGLDYACCALVVNWGAGCAGTVKIEHQDMQKIIDKGMLKVQLILKSLLE